MKDDPLRIGAAALTVASSLIASEGTARAASGRLLVFLHVAAKQRALQNALQGALDGSTVTAVGRVADLERGLADGQDAILTLPMVLASKGLATALRGFRESAAEETYSLVGAGKSPEPAQVKTVGALDILGRDGTTAFVQRLVGSQPKVERVTKLEDLLPLLQMQVADAILLPSRLFPEMKAVSRLELIATPVTQRVGLPAVASVGPAGPQLIAAIAKLPVEVLRGIGVESWR